MPVGNENLEMIINSEHRLQRLSAEQTYKHFWINHKMIQSWQILLCFKKLENYGASQKMPHASTGNFFTELCNQKDWQLQIFWNVKLSLKITKTVKRAITTYLCTCMS